MQRPVTGCHLPPWAFTLPICTEVAKRSSTQMVRTTSLTTLWQRRARKRRESRLCIYFFKLRTPPVSLPPSTAEEFVSDQPSTKCTWVQHCCPRSRTLSTSQSIPLSLWARHKTLTGAQGSYYKVTKALLNTQKDLNNGNLDQELEAPPRHKRQKSTASSSRAPPLTKTDVSCFRQGGDRFIRT